MDTAGHQHWHVTRLEAVMTETENTRLFVSGCAEEQAALYDRLGATILLCVPREIMIERLQSRSNNFYGRDPGEMAHIPANLKAVEPLPRAGCTHGIETTVPVTEVVDRILELADPTRR